MTIVEKCSSFAVSLFNTLTQTLSNGDTRVAHCLGRTKGLVGMRSPRSPIQRLESAVWTFIKLIAIYSIILTILLSAYLVLRHSYYLPSIAQARILFDNYFDLLAQETGANSSQSLRHPIDDLVLDARKKHESLVGQQSTTIHAAAERYRKRRGRHPPPGFDQWFKYAQRHDAVVVEEFFDRIEHDILPYWGLKPADIVTEVAARGKPLIRVRGGVALGLGETDGRPPWLQLWTDLLSEAAEWLPNLDMPINYMDESRVLAPWEDIEHLVVKAREQTRLTPVHQTMNEYSARPDAAVPSNHTEPHWNGPADAAFWDLARAACAPNSAARHLPALTNFSSPPEFPSKWQSPYSKAGFVQNFTASTDPCLQPHIRGMHGTFVEPISISTSQKLVPLFSGSKLPINNDLLIPGAMYLAEEDHQYSGGSSHGPPWEEKQGGIVWRGVASGGRNREDNWTRFQRHRLVEMLNATVVTDVEKGVLPRPMTFQMGPDREGYDVGRPAGTLGSWLETIADAGFVDLLCFPRDVNCAYIAPYFHTLDPVPMEKQYHQKFIPDVDGNSFSARFRALLLSTSLPLKATIYAEWHDDRLQPWLHFAPLDNTFNDLYAVLDFFTRDRKGNAAARMISETGKRWAEQVLRRQDMLLYVWRLLLEFARVCDANRDLLGFIDDLNDDHG